MNAGRSRKVIGREGPRSAADGLVTVMQAGGEGPGRDPGDSSRGRNTGARGGSWRGGKRGDRSNIDGNWRDRPGNPSPGGRRTREDAENDLYAGGNFNRAASSDPWHTFVKEGGVRPQVTTKEGGDGGGGGGGDPPGGPGGPGGDRNDPGIRLLGPAAYTIWTDYKRKYGPASYEVRQVRDQLRHLDEYVSNGETTASFQVEELKTKCDYSFHRPGSIIEYPQHSATGYPVSLEVLNQSISAFGPVYSKCRFVIVVARHAKHVTVVPVYTHRGDGIKYLNRDVKKEHMLVLDLEEKKNVVDKSETLFATRDKEYTKHRWFNTSTYVKFTELSPHSFHNGCNLLGRLEPRSLDLLQDMIVRHYRKYSIAFTT